MGIEEIRSSHPANLASIEYGTLSRTNDLSNPQQGTSGMKATVPETQGTGQQDTKESFSLSAKPTKQVPSNYVDDTRKLFVGGLPTDITDPEFRDFFSQFGELEEALVMFDRYTRRSRGFGFVTFVNSDVSKSLLLMGNQGDGIGRLVMRGKTCEVKAAAPKGHAPTRGGKANRNNRVGPRNHQQSQAYRMPSLAHAEQFPIMYENDVHHLRFNQGVNLPHAAAYHSPMYHPSVAHHCYDQPFIQPPLHGSFLLTTNCDHGVVDKDGMPYFLSAPRLGEQFGPSIVYSPEMQTGTYFHEHFYGYVPLAPSTFHCIQPVVDVECPDKPVEVNKGNS